MQTQPTPEDPATASARSAAAHHGSAAAALNYWERIGSRSGAWDREDYAFDSAIRRLASEERAAQPMREAA
jgi:hypothetical protein